MPFLFYPHARLGLAMVRNSDYFGWVHVNGAGFRGPEMADRKPEGVVRIISVGGSTTFDFQVTGDEKAWPARLEHYLGQYNSKSRAEVINAGVGGYRVIDNLIRLQMELHEIHPDIIILYHAHNDLFAVLNWRPEQGTERPNRPGQIQPAAPWTGWLRRHSLLYTKLSQRWKLRWAPRIRGALGGQRSEPDWSLVLARGAESFERDLASFVVVAQNMGIQVVLPEVVQISGIEADTSDNSQMERWKGTAPPAIVLEGYREYNARIRAVAEAHGATFIPTAAFGLTGDSLYAIDDPIHFNDAGADRMARQLADAMMLAGVLAR